MKHATGFLKLVTAARSAVTETSVARVKSWLKKRRRPVLIDVREEHEWNAAHIAGAIHLARGILERDIEKRVPDKQTEIVLYCGGGFRSVLSAESLNKMGYRNVASMRGGWRAWRKAKGPIVQGKRGTTAG